MALLSYCTTPSLNWIIWFKESCCCCIYKWIMKTEESYLKKIEKSEKSWKLLHTKNIMLIIKIDLTIIVYKHLLVFLD